MLGEVASKKMIFEIHLEENNVLFYMNSKKGDEQQQLFTISKCLFPFCCFLITFNLYQPPALL